MIDISYELCAIMISVVLMLNIIRIKRVRNLQNISFQLLIVFNGLTALFDVVKKYAMMSEKGAGVGFLDFCTMGYFITHVCVLPFLLIYIITLAMGWNEVPRGFKIIGAVPVTAAMLVIFSNPVTHIVYRIEEDGTYIRQKGIFAIYGIAGIYMVYNIYILARYYKKYSLVKRLSLYISIGLIVIGIVIQFLFPSLVVETVFNAVAMLFFFFMLQNPHNQLDNKTGMFNRVAFSSKIGSCLSAGKEFSLLFLVVENISDIRLQMRENVMYVVAVYLKGLDKSLTVYRIDNNTFCISAFDKSQEEMENLIKRIWRQFKKGWEKLETRVLLKPKICYLSFPCDIKKYDELRAVYSDLKERQWEDGRVFRERDFDLKNIVRAAQVSDALVRALEENRFEVNYTPIFELKKEKLYAAESNLKFKDNELGYIYEEEIQAIAEKSGKIAHLSKWILEETCKLISECHLERTRLRLIYVRLSTGLCLQYGYEDIILDTIRKYNIPPSMIGFMVSEYTVSRGAGLLKHGIRKLKETGISFCLENYGSGYTNISSLYELPFDYIEISRNVVRDAVSNEKSKTVMEYTLNLARDLHIETIVAGVNTEEQKLVLEGMECNYALGAYYLGQMDKKEFINLINDNPLNSMEGKMLVKMRMEERIAKEKAVADRMAEASRVRKKDNPNAPRVKSAVDLEKKKKEAE